MLDKTMTDRQRYWLGHIQAAADFEGAAADYARVHHLKTRDIYNWKSKLLKLKLYQPTDLGTSRGFVPVKQSRPQALSPSTTPANADRIDCTVTLTNGTRINFHGELSAQLIISIMASVSQVH